VQTADSAPATALKIHAHCSNNLVQKSDTTAVARCSYTQRRNKAGLNPMFGMTRRTRSCVYLQ